MRKRLRGLSPVFTLLLFLATGPLGAQAPTPHYSYTITATHPSDPTIFTQGILYQRVDGRDQFYVSSGLYRASRLRLVDLTNRQVLAERPLADRFFGEGITRVGDEIIQLTWKEGVAFRYRAGTLEPLGEFRYSGEGWGLTLVDGELVMSDGSNVLTVRDPATFEVRRHLHVTDRGRPVTHLNALQEIDGRIYANVWLTTRIARIELPSGEVSGWLDLAELVAEVERNAPGRIDVLNGIAYDSEQHRVFVTGKLWPWIFEIESPFFERRQ